MSSASLLCWREGNSAKHLARLCGAKRREMSPAIRVARRQTYRIQPVSHRHKFIRIGALIAVRADRRSDRVKVYGAISVYLASQVSAAARGRIQRRGIIGDAALATEL
jgi:hypothetical protein